MKIEMTMYVDRDYVVHWCVSVMTVDTRISNEDTALKNTEGVVF
jgi:hypothetical protein